MVERLIDVEKAASSNLASRTMMVLNFFLLCVCLVVLLFVLLFFLAQIISIFTADAPFVPIPREIEDKIIESLKLNEDSVLYDLGCGDGRVLKSAVEKYPNIKAVGIEIAFIPYLLARFKTRKNKNIEIRREDIFKTDIANATHIFTYLYPKVMEKLMPVLEKKCRSGTRIVSCDFEDKNRKPTEIIELSKNNSGRGKRLIIYSL